jgi:putative pyruvate formate lyase activating enzyme
VTTAAQRCHAAGALEAKAAAALAELSACHSCPRDCGADRRAAPTPMCRIGSRAVVSSAFPHHGEEQSLSGRRGSGTIFFSGCNLRCVFCQNWEISQSAAGRVVGAAALAEIMLGLQHRGCHNINLVTPEHVVPHIVEALAIAVPAGLSLPIVYNTSAYDSLRALRLMDGLVDVYMPDFKIWEPETARRLLRASDYPHVARLAITEMHRQVGDLVLDSDGLARRGLLVRHLVVPGLERDTAAILDWIASAVSPDTHVNVMGQYRPDHRVPGRPRYADIDRNPTPDELAAARRAAIAAGLRRLEG